MPDARYLAMTLVVIAAPAMSQSAFERETLGSMSVAIGDTETELEIFIGPLLGVYRTLAGYNTRFGGDGGIISIEALQSGVPAGAHPMQGSVVMHLDFTAPAPLDASSPHDSAAMFFVGDWVDGAEMPEQAFGNATSVAVDLEHLELAEGTARIAGSASARMCPYDIVTEEVSSGSDACFDMSARFDTALLRFAPPVPVEDTSEAVEAEEGPITMDVLGQVTATLDGQEREWLTIAGRIRGRDVASANWQRIEFSVPGFAETFGDIADDLTDEERAQLDMLDGFFSDNNPLAGIVEELTGEPAGTPDDVSLTISGHDPESSNILTEQVLSLDIYLTTVTPPLGVPLPVDVTFFVEASDSFIPAVFYVSGEDGTEASVTFEALDLTPGGGHARGTFQATLCRMEGARLMDGADLSDCMPVEGSFDTALIEEEAQPD
ncbi:MAG: hypothetical protein JJT81_01895 [Rubellimicrobium sp.]|nr:hypothetical protein [Rubellimicrobium sp.]